MQVRDPGSRFFLIKQGQDAVVARLDLRGMDDIVNVLSGRSDTVLLLYDIMKRYGDNPFDWLPVFYKECIALQNKSKQ